MSFLPEGYKIPEKSNYTKFAQGETIIRILESPILGWELWVNNKPVRFNMTEEIPMEVMDSADIDPRTKMPKPPKHFWAMVVWNYEINRLQIWQITQKSIIKKIKGLSKSKVWGTPLDYDLSITKDGEGLETEYDTQPAPKMKLDSKIQQAFENAQIDTKKLYTGDNPFSEQRSVNEAPSDITEQEQFVKDVEDSVAETNSKDLPF